MQEAVLSICPNCSYQEVTPLDRCPRCGHLFAPRAQTSGLVAMANSDPDATIVDAPRDEPIHSEADVGQLQQPDHPVQQQVADDAEASFKSIEIPVDDLTKETGFISTKLCLHCGFQVHAKFKFCTQCGAPLNVNPKAAGGLREGMAPVTSDWTTERSLRISKLRDGVTTGKIWLFAAGIHGIGRSQGAVRFPKDPFMSPIHASLEYKPGQLILRDQQSVNGVFVRIQKPERIRSGDKFTLGSQLLQFFSNARQAAQSASLVDSDETYLLGSPKISEAIVITRLFENGEQETFLRYQKTVSIGRAGCDINFPEDQKLGMRHAAIVRIGRENMLEDLTTEAGTFMALRGGRILESGDEFNVGCQTLRVEF